MKSYSRIKIIVSKLIALIKILLMLGGLYCVPMVVTGMDREYSWITTVRFLKGDCVNEGDIRTSPVPEMNLQFKEWHDLHADIKDLLQGVAAARRYARNSQAINILNEAFRKGKGTLGRIEQYQNQEVLNDAVMLAPSAWKESAKKHSKATLQKRELLVCPEVYRGQLYDYPDHRKSMNSNCTQMYRVKPLSESLTIILNFFNEIDPKFAGQIFSGIQNSLYRKLPILVVKSESQSIESTGLNTRVIVPDSRNPEFFLKKVLPLVSTPYVLFSRRLERFDSFAMLERLVRVASYLKVDVVGGSHRQADGKWMNGCYQISLRNYTVRMVEGFDLSYNSSLYCEYITGPFVAHVSTVKHVLASRTKFHSDIKDHSSSVELFYFDLFLTLILRKSIVMDCPDVMFHTSSAFFEGYKLERGAWKVLAKHWDVHRLYFSDVNIDINYSCNELGHVCPDAGGVIFPPCCYKEHTDLFNFVASSFENAGIQTFIDTGTLLGAVKISNTVPWPGDHDISVPDFNSAALIKLMKSGIFEKQGYSWTQKGNIYVNIMTRHSHIEVYVEKLKFFKDGREEGLHPTQVLLGGRWQTAPTSPAMVSRNQFGPSAYEHAEPWFARKADSGFSSYENATDGGTFLPCPVQGHHGCMDQYSTDGNLQFRDHWI